MYDVLIIGCGITGAAQRYVNMEEQLPGKRVVILGDVVLANVCGTGVNIVATKDDPGRE